LTITKHKIKKLELTKTRHGHRLFEKGN